MLSWYGIFFLRRSMLMRVADCCRNIYTMAGHQHLRSEEYEHRERVKSVTFRCHDQNSADSF